jgi:chemotaxis protein CheX
VDTRNEFVEAFVAAVPFALREMASVEAIARDAHRATDAKFADLSAVIRLHALHGDGQLVLSLPQQTATALAQRILAEVADGIADDLVRDCMGEVANVVAGQAKALLVGSPAHFTLSTPVVRTGDLADLATERWVIPFDSDAGAFSVHLYPPS